MNPIRLLLVAFFCIALFPNVQAEIPSLSAAAVAQIAQKDLEERNLHTEIFVAEIEYKGKFGTPYWMVFWSKTFPAQTDGGKEWGLRIQMDGSFVRMVRKR